MIIDLHKTLEILSVVIRTGWRNLFKEGKKFEKKK